MSTNVSWNGSTYAVPATGEENWGGTTKVDGLLIALATHGLSKSGGNFTLSADVDFGGTAGLKTTYYKSRHATIATAGQVRLANTEAIGFRNAADSANLLLGPDTSNNLTWNGAIVASSSGVVPVASGGTGLTSYTAGDMIYASGATTLAKLALGAASRVLTSTGSSPPAWALIANANIDASAAIAYSKLNLATSIVNADVSATAVIAYSKLAALTASRALASDGSGVVAVTAVTATELGFVAGLTTSAVGATQTQTLSGKTFSDSITMAQIATPSNPSAGYDKVYVKSGDTLNWLDSSGTEHAAMDTATSAYSLRNWAINGIMNFWQRGTSFAAAATGQYSADRFMYVKATTGAAHTLSQSSDVPTLAEASAQASYSLLVDCTTADAAVAAGDLVAIRYGVEGYDYAILKNRTVILSFWVKATKTGTYCVAFSNSGSDRSYVAEYTVSVTDTWEKKSVSLALNPSGGTDDYTTGLGLQIRWALMAGSTYQTTAGSWQTGNFYATSSQVNACDDTANNFRLTLVQLNLGSTVPVGYTLAGGTIPGELVMSQRYYEKSYSPDVAPATATDDNITNIRANSSSLLHTDVMKVTKRVAPTVTFYNPVTGTADQIRNYTTAGNHAIGTVATSVSTFRNSTGVTADGDSVGWHWTANAEFA